MGEAVHATSHFKVDPTVADEIFKCVFINEFFGDVGDLDADVFWLVQGGVEIEVLEIKGGKRKIEEREILWEVG